MDITAAQATLAATPGIVEALFDGVDEAGARRRPAPGKWSLLEVLGHLYDEEQEDFRVRLQLTLETPHADWPAIDPEGRVAQRAHNEREPSELLIAFRHERQGSLAWLACVQQADWERAHEHPVLGPLRAGDLLAAWAAHDLLHLQQLMRLRLAALAAQMTPYHLRYAAP
jgi:hypothetical protein